LPDPRRGAQPALCDVRDAGLATATLGGVTPMAHLRRSWSLC
jgi:hypothetical protein